MHQHTTRQRVQRRHKGKGHRDDLAPSFSNVLALQRQAGNHAVATLLSERPGPGLAVQRSSCGCKGSCACAKGDEQSEASVQRVDYSKTHRCNIKETGRVISSWSIAVAKLTENLPFLGVAQSTGLHSSQLKAKLEKHFSATTKQERQQVLDVIYPGYSNILLRMGPAIVKVRCGGDSCEHGDYAYTYSGAKDSTMWFCNVQFLDKPILDLAATWIHELSHAFYDTDDSGYYNYKRKNPHASPALALKNADSWGNFMVDYT